MRTESYVVVQIIPAASPKDHRFVQMSRVPCVGEVVACQDHHYRVQRVAHTAMGSDDKKHWSDVDAEVTVEVVLPS